MTDDNFSYTVHDVEGEKSHPKKTRLMTYSSYDKYWGNVYNIMEKEITHNPAISLESLWINIFRGEVKKNSPIFRKNELVKLINTFQSWKQNVNGPINIIDMGSGWGRYSTALKIRDIQEDIYALEFTESGRKITKFISNKYLDNQIKSFPFDYYNSDFSMVPVNSDVFVYSTYSIEQIAHLKKDVFLNLTKRFKNVRGFHLEPVGWQFPAPHSKHEIQLKAKSKRVGYNVNFYDVIMELVKDNVIKIVEIIRDFKSDRTDGTLLIWDKVM